MGRPKHPDVLTPREWEVLALLREGRSNDEIADALGITVATARFHVSEILSKLGVANRREAAAWQPEPARRHWAWIALPLGITHKLDWHGAGLALAATITAAAVVLVAFLAWGVSRTSSVLLASDGPVCGTPLPITPTPLDQAALRAIRSTAVVVNATWDALTEQQKRDSASTPGPASLASQTADAIWLAQFNALHCDLHALPIVQQTQLGSGPDLDPVGSAALIIRGRVGSVVFGSGEFSRTTTSAVRVTHVYKGSVAPGSTVAVWQPGGPSAYNGGTTIGEFIEQDLLLGGEDVLLLLLPNGGAFMPAPDNGIYFIRNGRVYPESGYPPPDAPFRGNVPARISGTTLDDALALLKIARDPTPTP